MILECGRITKKELRCRKKVFICVAVVTLFHWLIFEIYNFLSNEIEKALILSGLATCGMVLILGVLAFFIFEFDSWRGYEEDKQ